VLVKFQDAGCGIHDAGRKMQDARCSEGFEAFLYLINRHDERRHLAGIKVPRLPAGKDADDAWMRIEDGG